MTKLPVQPPASERANLTILAGSRTLDGVSANAATIPAIAPHTNPCSDAAKAITEPPATAPLAQTSRRRFLMNTMVSAASIATATAVALPPAAASTPNAASFPAALVARFLRVHGRWTSKRAKDKAYSDMINRLLFDATGITYEEYGAIDVHDPRWQKCLEAVNKIIEENPDSGPVDEHGSDVEWDEIHGDLQPVAEAILKQQATSVADLAWQAEAIVTWDTCFFDREDTTTLMLGRLLQNVRALAGPLPLLGKPVEISTGSEAPEAADPILAAIEAHRTAEANHSAAVRAQCNLEKELPRDKRRSTLTVWEETIVETDDPRWPAAERACRNASNAADAAAMALLDIKPTTVAGAAALLKYVAAEDDLTFPDDLEDDDGESLSFGRAIAGHVGEALSGLR